MFRVLKRLRTWDLVDLACRGHRASKNERESQDQEQAEINDFNNETAEGLRIKGKDFVRTASSSSSVGFASSFLLASTAASNSGVFGTAMTIKI
jgi:hypothetical protein